MATSMSDNVTSIAGFKVLPVRFNAKSKAGHYLYYKEHTVRGSSSITPSDRTIFVLNVPPYCNKECFKRLFGDFGKVGAVFLQDKPTSEPMPESPSHFFPKELQVQGFKVAYIVFDNPASVERAMSRDPPDEPFVLSTEKHPILTGYKKWCTDYVLDRPNVEKLQKDIDEFMKTHDQDKEEENRLARETEGVEDEEGWVTVTRKTTKKQRPVARTETMQKRVQSQEKEKREKKELVNFYSFQMRETKREHIAELRRKFEEDKNRIAQMKATRKFKPY